MRCDAVGLLSRLSKEVSFAPCASTERSLRTTASQREAPSVAPHVQHARFLACARRTPPPAHPTHPHPAPRPAGREPRVAWLAKAKGQPCIGPLTPRDLLTWSFSPSFSFFNPLMRMASPSRSSAAPFAASLAADRPGPSLGACGGAPRLCCHDACNARPSRCAAPAVVRSPAPRWRASAGYSTSSPGTAATTCWRRVAFGTEPGTLVRNALRSRAGSSPAARSRPASQMSAPLLTCRSVPAPREDRRSYITLRMFGGSNERPRRRKQPTGAGAMAGMQAGFDAATPALRAHAVDDRTKHVMDERRREGRPGRACIREHATSAPPGLHRAGRQLRR